MMKRLLLITILILGLSIPAAALPIYEGMLSTPDGVIATGIWANGFKISWHIEQQTDLSWFYRYRLSDLQGVPFEEAAVSHFTIEVSPNVTREDFWGFNGGPVVLGSWDESDYMAHSLKFDYGSDGQLEWNGYSSRAPVWGDFYAKDGRAGGLGWNTAKNAGYLDPDPVVAPTNGSIGNKILRPDTYTDIPEPGTLGLLGLGILGAAARLRRRANKK
jgi:hypothetical protein